MDTIFADTNSIIKLLEGNEIIDEILSNKIIFISEMTEMEMLCKFDLTKAQRKLIREMLDDCVIVPFNAAIKHKAIQIRLTTRMKLIDSIIVASAVEMKAKLVTSDLKFESAKNIVELILVQA
jgi:predicted nucleic acid-binding protein